MNFDGQKGPSSVLTKAEENQFADWLIELANRGFGLSRDGFLKAVKKFLDKDGRTTPFKDNKPGNKWFGSFIKRNPKVKLCKARSLQKKRASISKDAVDTWFKDFATFLIEKVLQIALLKSGIAMRMGLTYEGWNSNWTINPGSMHPTTSFQEVESTSRWYLVSMHVYSGCRHTSSSLESASW